MGFDTRDGLRVLRFTQVRHPDRNAAPTSSIPGPNGARILVPRVTLADGIERISNDVAAARSKASEHLFKAYYPAGHKRLHPIRGALDLRSLGEVGRVDEVTPLRKSVLVMPTALAGDYPYSPNAKALPQINQHRAFRDHGNLVRTLLDGDPTVPGEVYLILNPPAAATEATYATDVLSAIVDRMLVAEPLQDARLLERTMYRGGERLGNDGLRDAPVEFGDRIDATKNGVYHYLQGIGSMRATEASSQRMERYLQQLGRETGRPIVHMPIRLQGADTLHLDYAVNYAGDVDNRCMVVCADAIADANDIDRMSEVFGAKHVHVVTRAEMLQGAANLSNISPGHTIIAQNAQTASTAEFLRRHGIVVHELAMESHKKDGTGHCCIAQALRK